VTQGNYDALAVAHLSRYVMGRMGLNPERLHIAFMSGGDGNILVDEINGFSRKIRELGPLGAGEGLDGDLLRLKLRAAEKLVPFLRLVERERLRAPSRSKKGYEEFFGSDEVKALLDGIVADKMAVGQIMLLLQERPLSTAQISERLSLSPSEVSKHMNSSSRHGMVRYDVERKCYSLA
jgi:biotin operon repressor